MKKYLISTILILLLSSTILATGSESLKKNKHHNHKHHKHHHNLLQTSQDDEANDEELLLDDQELEQDQDNEENQENIGVDIVVGEDGNFDVSVSPHIEQFSTTPEQNDELFAANYNFEDYYAEIKSIVDADLAEVQTKLAEVSAQCTEYEGQNVHFEDQILYYNNYNTYLEGKIEENLAKIEKIYDERCEAHGIFIEYAKNARITIRLLNFLEEALENYSFTQLRSMNRVLNKYMSAPVVSNNESLKAMIQALQNVDSEQYDLEEREDVGLRTEEQIGEGHIDTSSYGEFQLEDQELRGNQYLDDYKVQLKEIIDELRSSMEESLGQRQDSEIELNGKTSEFVYKLETDNAYMRLQIERNEETLDRLNAELQATQYLLAVCKVDQDWLINVQSSQQTIVDSVYDSEESLRGQYDLFWSVRPDLWQLGSDKVFDLYNYDGFGLKVPQPGLQNFLINFDFANCAYCSGGAVATDKNYQTLYSVGANVAQSTDGALSYSQNDLGTSLSIQFSTLQESVSKIYIFVTVEGEETTFEEVFQNHFSMVIQEEEFAQFKVNPSQLPGSATSTFLFAFEFYQKISIVNGNEEKKEWYVVPTLKFSEGTPRAPTQAGVASTLSSFSLKPVHGSGEDTYTWDAEFDRPVNVRNYASAGIKVPESGLNEIIIGLDYDGDYEVNAGFVTVDQLYEITSVVSVGTTTEDINNQLYLKQITTQFTDEEDKLQMSAGLNSVLSSNDAVFVVLSITGSTFNAIEKQRVSLYIGGKLFAFLIQYPSQNLDCYGTSSYLAFKFYRNPNDNMSWYVQYVDQWVDLNIDGSSAQTTNSEGVRRAIRNQYWDIHYYGFGQDYIVPDWGRDSIVIELSSEEAIWLDFGVVVVDQDDDIIVSTVSKNSANDGVFSLKNNRSISFNLNKLPETYKETNFIVYIENESYFFNSKTTFNFKVTVAGTRIVEYTVKGSPEKEDLVFYTAFQLSQDGVFTYKKSSYANCPRSIDGGSDKLFEVITGRKITGSAVLRSSVEGQNLDQFQIPSQTSLGLGVMWTEEIDIDIVLYVIKDKEVDDAPFVNFSTRSYQATQITLNYNTIESREAWSIDLPNLDEDIDHMIVTAAIYDSSYYYDDFSELTINFYSNGQSFAKYTIDPSSAITDSSQKTTVIFGDLYKKDGQWYYKKLNTWVGQDTQGNWARYANSQNTKDTIRVYLGFEQTNIEEIKMGKYQLPAFVNSKEITFEYDWSPDFNLDVVCYVLRDGQVANAPYVDPSNTSFNGGQITWKSGDDDSDERFVVDFGSLDSNVTHLLIAVSIVDPDVFFDSVTTVDIRFNFLDATFAYYTIETSETLDVDQYTTIILGEIFIQGDSWFYERYDRYVATDYEGTLARGNDKTLRNIVSKFKQVVDIEKQEKFEISKKVAHQVVAVEFDWEPETDLDIILYIVKNGDVENATYVNFGQSSYESGVISWGSASADVDESITINLTELEESVDQLILVACVYETNYFDFIEAIDITFTAASIPFAEQLIHPAQLEGSSTSTALILGQFFKTEFGWNYERLNYFIEGTDSNGEYPRTANFKYITQQAALVTKKIDLNKVSKFELPEQCQSGIVSLSYDWSPETNLDINLYLIKNGDIDNAPVVNETVQNYNTDQVQWGGADNEGEVTYDEQFQIDFSKLDEEVQHLVVVVSIYETNFFDYIDEVSIAFRWNGAIFATATFDPQSLENSESSTAIILGQFELEQNTWWYYRWNSYVVGADSNGNYPRTFESQYTREVIKTKLGYTKTEITNETTGFQIPVQAYDAIIAFNFDWQPDVNLDIIMFIITDDNTIETAPYVNYSVSSYNEDQVAWNSASEGYDEQFLVNFSTLDENVKQMIIVVCVYESSFYDTIESSRFYLSYNGFVFADETLYPQQMSGAAQSTALVLGECKKEGSIWWYYRWNRLIVGADSDGNFPRTVESEYLRQMLILQLTTTNINNSQSYKIPEYVQNQTVKVKYDWTPDLNLDILMYVIENRDVDNSPYVNQQNQSYNNGVISWGGSDDNSDEKFSINFGALDASVDHLITTIMVQGEAFYDSIQELDIQYTFNGIAFATQSLYPDQIENAGTYTAIVLGEYVRNESGEWVYYRWNKYFDTIRNDSSSIIRDYIIQHFGYYKFYLNKIDTFELPNECYEYIVTCNYDWQPQISVDIIMYIVKEGDLNGAEIVDYQTTSYDANQIQWRAQGANDQDEFYIDFNSLGSSVDHLVIVICLWENFYTEMESIQVYFNYNSFAFAEELIEPSTFDGADDSTALVLGQFKFEQSTSRWHYYKYNRLITGTDSNGMYPRSANSVFIRKFLTVLLGYYQETIETSEWKVPSELVGSMITVEYDWQPETAELSPLLYVVTDHDVYSAPLVGAGTFVYGENVVTYNNEGVQEYDIDFSGFTGAERICVVMQMSSGSGYYESIGDQTIKFKVGGNVFATSSFNPSALPDASRSGVMFLGEFKVSGDYWYYYSYNELIINDDANNRAGDTNAIRQYIAQSLGWEAQNINADGGFNFSHTATGNKVTVKYDWEPSRDMDIGVYIVTDNNDISEAPYINYSNRSYDEGQIYYGDDSWSAEQFDIQLDKLKPEVQRLVIVICMYSSGYYMNYIESLETTFIYNGEVIAESMQYPQNLPDSSNTTSIIMGEIKRTSAGWRYYEYYTPVYGTDSEGSWPRHVSSQLIKNSITEQSWW